MSSVRSEYAINRLRQRNKHQADKENREASSKAGPSKNHEAARVPLLDLQSNKIIKCRARTDEGLRVQGKHKDKVKLTVAAVKNDHSHKNRLLESKVVGAHQKGKSKSASATSPLNEIDTKLITFRDSRTTSAPKLEDFPIDSSIDDEVFVPAEEHFITYTDDYQPRKAFNAFKDANVSPFVENEYTKPNVLLLIENPEKLVRRPTVKRTLSHRLPIESGVTREVHQDEMFSEYLEDIVAHFRLIEQKYVEKEGFLNTFNPDTSNRGAVVNWLLKFQTIFALSSTALQTSIRLFDHILSLQPIPVNMLVLVGVTTLWITAKLHFKDIITPSKIITLSGHAYTKTQLLKMERKICRVLQFNLMLPDPLIFVTYYLNLIGRNDKMLQSMVTYAMECQVLLPSFSTLSVSQAAAVVTYLALVSLNPIYKVLWQTLKFYDKEIWSSDDIAQHQNELEDFLRNIRDCNNQYHHVYKKYSSQEYDCVSVLFLKELAST